MRQTRRSRSAATPQKNESAPEVEEVTTDNSSVKANLGTVFEQESEMKEEASDAGAGEANAAECVSAIDSGAVPSDQNETSEVSVEEEKPADAVEGSVSPKKTTSEDIELRCQVCNCSFTNYHEHMNSEAHKAKISHSNPKTDPPTNSEAIKGSPKPNPATQALKRSSEQDGAPSPKRMKGQLNNAPIEKFHCETCKLTILRKQDFEHHMSGKRHLINASKAQGKSYCEVCKLFFNAVSDYNDHTDSQLHKTNVAEKKQDKRSFECDLCKATLIGEKQYEQHLSSKRHKRSLETPSAGAGTSAPTQPKAVNGGADPKVVKPQKKMLYMCNACNFTCNQDQQFSAHMNLAEHKASVADMKRKGLLFEKPAFANARKFVGNNATPAAQGNTVGGNKKPDFFKANVKAGASGPAVNNTVAKNLPSLVPKQGPAKINTMPNNRKPVVGGPNKNTNVMKPNAPPIKPLVNIPSNRPNPRFVGKQVDGPPQKFMPNPAPMTLGFQKMPYDAPGNFGPSFESNASSSFGSYRPIGSFAGDGRSDNVSQGANVRDNFRGDFRGNVRDDYRGEIRDIRNVELGGGDNRGDNTFRSGFYREISTDVGRDSRDYRGSFRGDGPLDVRSDLRPVQGADARGDVRAMGRNDMRTEAVPDVRSYGNSDIRDLRNDSRSDFMRDRSSLSSYANTAGYGQSYRGSGVDDFRQDNYSNYRAAQSSASGVSAGNYSGMAGNRYDSYMDRTSAGYSNPNQYPASSRGYMSDLPLNGR